MTFEEEISSVEPDVRYDYIIQDIIRDKNSSWSHDYYSNSSSTWTIKQAISQSEIDRLNSRINVLNGTMKKLDQQIANSKLNPNEKGFKSLSPADIERIDQGFKDAVYEIRECQGDLDSEKPKCEQFRFNAMVDSRRIVGLRDLRNRFVMDGDLDFLSRGVTWVHQRYYREIGGEPPDIKPPSGSAW